MLIISLDEYGDFEGLKKKNEPIFIAGLIFDDKDIAGEEIIERKRIKAYYEAVITEAAQNADVPAMFSYPEALHSNGDSLRDHNVVRPVKQLVGKTLAEFIQKGTYKEKKLQWTNAYDIVRDFRSRRGEYHVFAILKSDAGIRSLLNKRASFLVRDNYASNLYFHMADELMRRLIFHNPVINDVKNISLDIATRTSEDMCKSDTLAKEYWKLGYKGKYGDDKNDSKVYYQLTNADVYRTAVAKEIIEAECPDIVISDFHVASITYKKEWKNMEFLYMADTICSVLQYRISGNNADDWLNAIVERTKKITGKSDNLIFGYDEIDVLYAKAWAKYREGDFYSALSMAFDAGKQNGSFVDYYKKVWFKKLEEHILENEEVSGFKMAVRKLNDTLVSNSLDQEKAKYILEVIEKSVPKMEGKFHTPEAKSILYQLYDTGVSVYCHIGDSRNAEKYFEKCKERAGSVSIDTFLNTQDKMVVYCSDYVEFDRAEAISNENISYQEYLADIKNEVHAKLPFMSEFGDLSLGKAFSQCAQVYAFKRDPRAEDMFRKALGIIEKGSANYKITQSYLLHYYLDAGRKEAYLKEAEDYFGGRIKLADQLLYIIDEGSKDDSLINLKYALYVYVKALYLFRLEEMKKSDWDDLQNIEKKYSKKIAQKEWRLSGHPAELIFKYLRLIAVSRGQTESEELYAARMEECLTACGATIDAIKKFGEIEIEHAKGNLELRDKLSFELYKFLSEKFSVFADLEIPKEGETRFQWLGEVITFMYR